jgi:hypothetical protein
MNCVDAKSQLVDLLYGELSSHQERTLSEHFAGCHSCRAERDSLVEARNWLDQVEEPATNPRLDASMLQRTAAKQSKRRHRRRRVAVVAASLVAAVVVLMVAGPGWRCEIHQTHIVLAWGEPRQPRPEKPPTTDLRPLLDEQRREMREFGELLTLTAREVLDTDRRCAEDLTELNRRWSAYQSETSQQLKRLQVQSDLRWRLIVDEFSQRHDRSTVEVSRAESNNAPISPKTGTER